jgi:hypothetical protein
MPDTFHTMFRQQAQIEEISQEESSKEYSRNWARLIQWICAGAIDFND